MTKQRGRAKVRLTVKLDVEWDADVIAWLMTVPRGQRSTAVRDAISSVIRPGQAGDLAAIRAVVAEELARALAKQSSRFAAGPAMLDGNTVEAKYGAKLDQMLGGLSNLPGGPGRDE